MTDRHHSPRAARADGERHPTAGRTVGLGVQHALVMYAGAIAVPLMFGAGAGLDEASVGVLDNADVCVADVITLVRSLGVGRLLGARLPLVTGGSFVCVTPMITIAREYGMPAVYGSMIDAGLLGMLVAGPFARVLRAFPPLVSGVVVTVVGLALLGTAPGMIAGPDPTAADCAPPAHLALAGGVIALLLLFRRLLRGCQVCSAAS
ncbi:solute carrier family 23 protein [Streptomyces noursei]|uniref:solute carrier family 23 protein n=1 Tax=Streptomyces noursei TaxID=1971 RepID=UPI003815F268